MTLKIFDVYGPILALDKLSCEKCMGDMMSRHILGIYVVGIHMYPKNDSCNGLLVHIVTKVPGVKNCPGQKHGYK